MPKAPKSTKQSVAVAEENPDDDFFWDQGSRKGGKTTTKASKRSGAVAQADSDEELREGDHVMDRGVRKAVKTCLVCQRPFTWRKKWERCWDEVTTCSDACKRKKKQQSKADRPATEDEEGCPEKKSATRTKQCALCEGHVELAYRCKWRREQAAWEFICRPCWPRASGEGYLESPSRGEASPSPSAPAGNPYYVYGGTWKATIGETKGEIARRELEARSPNNTPCDPALPALDEEGEEKLSGA